MIQQPTAAAPLRPTVIDYLLILAGYSLSLFLIRLKPWNFVGRESLAVPVGRLVGQLGDIIRLTEGVILLWPLFRGLQSVRGRSQSLTVGEWLWVIAWLCVAVLTGLALWQVSETAPDWIRELDQRPRWIYYMIVAPSMGVLAILFTLAGLVSRGGTPWTHSFSLALVSWPVLPLAGILTLAK